MAQAQPDSRAFQEAGAATAATPAFSLVHGDDPGAIALLYDISRELTSILDREELLRRIAERVKRLADYQVFSVMLWNEKHERLEHVFALQYGQEIQLKMTLALGEGLCGTAAQERRPVRVSNVARDPRYIQCELGTGVRSELVVPLVTQGKLIGVLDVESTGCSAFTEQHEQMLATLAPYIAIALENARLYREVRRKEEQLASELATARDIQKQLLPEAAPHVSGLEVGVSYVPAWQLGGDFYDFPSYGEGRMAVAVGDVAGKGTAAALCGALAIGTLREHVAEHPCAPAEMLELLNRRLQGLAVPGRFVAMLFGVYDATSQTLHLSNAGFPRPVVVRDGRVEVVRVEGVPLGLLPDIQYDELRLDLLPGDVIVLCSDGVHEAMNHCEEEFGQARLSEMLAGLAREESAQQIADAILHATHRYAADNGSPSDDCTVVVLKVKPSDRLGRIDPLY